MTSLLTAEDRARLRRRERIRLRHKLEVGSLHYGRHHLWRLLPWDDHEALRYADPEIVLARIQVAIRAEREKERAGHWSFDLNRLTGLHMARIAEIRMARAIPFAEAA